MRRMERRMEEQEATNSMEDGEFAIQDVEGVFLGEGIRVQIPSESISVIEGLNA